MLRHISGHRLIRDPKARELRFASEDDRFVTTCSSCCIFFPTDRQIHLYVAARAGRLCLEIVGKMLRVLPEVAMNVDHHVGHNSLRKQPSGAFSTIVVPPPE